MTREEKKIWQVTYAAAFTLFATQQHKSGPRIMLDRQNDDLHAISAIQIANRAIAALRDRRRAGDPNAGKQNPW